MTQRPTEPMSAELHATLVKLVGERRANELRDRDYPKAPISYSLSYEARSGLKQIASQMGFIKGGTYPGSKVSANVSALLEAIGLGYIFVYKPTPEEVIDRRHDPIGYPYVLYRESIDDDTPPTEEEVHLRDLANRIIPPEQVPMGEFPGTPEKE